MLDALLMKISLVLRGAFSEKQAQKYRKGATGFFSLLSRFGRTLLLYASTKARQAAQKNIAPSNFLVKYLLQAEKFDIEKTK